MIWLLCLYIRSAFAIGLESRYFELVAQAKTPLQVRTLAIEFDRIRVARKACRIQVRRREVPTACFETLDWENRWKISQTPRHIMMNKLNEICERAEVLRVPEHLDLKFVSPPCRARVLEAQRVQEYRREAWYED